MVQKANLLSTYFVNDPIELKGSFTNYVAKKRWVGYKTLIKQTFCFSYLVRALGNQCLSIFKVENVNFGLGRWSKKTPKLVDVIYEKPLGNISVPFKCLYMECGD